MALGLLGILGLGGVGAGIAGGLGYGFGIRYGFERIFPSFQQGGPQKAIQTAAGDIAQLLGTQGFDSGQAETDTFLGNITGDDGQIRGQSGAAAPLGDVINNGPSGPTRGGDLTSVATDVRKTVTIRQTQMGGIHNQSNFTGKMTVDELRALVNQYEKYRINVGLKSTAGRRITQSINSVYQAIRSF